MVSYRVEQGTSLSVQGAHPRPQGSDLLVQAIVELLGLP